MVSRNEGFFVLYPVYFDAGATRAKGRRVPDASAVRGATAKSVFEAAQAAGLAPVLEDEHHHPSAWFERTGRVLVPSKGLTSKSEAIARVAEHLEAAPPAPGQRPPGVTGGHRHHKKKKGRRRR